MKEQDVITRVLAGNPTVIAEYRRFREDTLKWRDKQTGRSVERQVVKHSLEVGEMQCVLMEWLPDGAKPGEAKPAHKKGDRVVVSLKGMEREGDFYAITGEITPLEK